MKKEKERKSSEIMNLINYYR